MTYRLAHHPLVLQASLQAFLVRMAFAREGQDEVARRGQKLAAWHLKFTAGNIWEEKP